MISHLKNNDCIFELFSKPKEQNPKGQRISENTPVIRNCKTALDDENQMEGNKTTNNSDSSSTAPCNNFSASTRIILVRTNYNCEMKYCDFPEVDEEIYGEFANFCFQNEDFFSHFNISNFDDTEREKRRDNGIYIVTTLEDDDNCSGLKDDDSTNDESDAHTNHSNLDEWVQRPEMNVGALCAVATSYRKKKKYKESLEILEIVLESHVKVHGEVHYLVGSCLHNIGVVYLLVGQYDDSLSSFERAVKICKQSLGITIMS